MKNRERQGSGEKKVQKFRIASGNCTKLEWVCKLCAALERRYTVKDCDANDAANEMEIGQVVRIDRRVRVDLERVNILAGVLEQAVVWIQHFVRQQIKPFTSDSTVICEKNFNALVFQVLLEWHSTNAPNHCVRLISGTIDWPNKLRELYCKRKAIKRSK